MSIQTMTRVQFVIENISELENELKYWMSNHNVKIGKNRKNYTVAVYKDL